MHLWLDEAAIRHWIRRRHPTSEPREKNCRRASVRPPWGPFPGWPTGRATAGPCRPARQGGLFLAQLPFRLAGRFRPMPTQFFD